MKILFLIDTLRAGGAERRLVELLKGLSKSNNITFSIIIMNSNVHYDEVYDLCDVHLVNRHKGFDIRTLIKVIFLYKKIKPDLIHSWSGITTYYAIPLKILFRTKIIGSYITGSRYVKYKYLFPFTDLIIANSYAGLKANLAPSQKSKVIYNGFDFNRINNLRDKEELIAELIIPSGFYIVGMVASFTTSKDYNSFINAAFEVLKQINNVVFLCIGDGDDSFYKQKTSTFQKHFRFLGKRHDVEDLINMMDVCVLTTFTEGVSNAVLEYMALQKPVVASGEGGLSEIIENNESGFLFPVGEFLLVAEKIIKLLNNKKLKQTMGVKGGKIVEEKFPINKMITEYIQVYNNFL